MTGQSGEEKQNERQQSETPGAGELGEKALDMAFGLAATVGEVAGRVGGYVMSNAPAFFDSLEAKGRPLREKVTTSVRGGLHASLREASESAEDEIEALERRVRELEASIGAAEAAAPTEALGSNDKTSEDRAA
jgi:hypothetical protein